MKVCIKDETTDRQPRFTGLVLQGADWSVQNCRTGSRWIRIFGQIDLNKSYKPLVYLPDIDLC